MMAEVATIRETVKRLKSDGLPVSEYTLRRWVRTGVIPSVSCGAKALLYYPNILSFIQNGNHSTMQQGKDTAIRRVGV